MLFNNITMQTAGGKAYSLHLLKKEGFNVPDFFVLPVSFFYDWSVAVNSKTSSIDDLYYTEKQKKILEECRVFFKSGLVAVRSSCVGEDGDTASFAGEYHTELSVKLEDLEKVILTCFNQSFSERVKRYKENKEVKISEGFDIALLIQRQISSSVSGVGFSLNPINNDYDEAVINANFGLGETVVSGEVTPDSFTFNKVSRNLIKKTIAKKSVIKLVNEKGGVVKKDIEGLKQSINITEQKKILDLIIRVEKFYKKPIDIEWAIFEDTLYLLQARPITTFHPLHIDMQTKPGSQRRLYLDAGLFDAITTNIPMTTLSTDLINKIFTTFFKGFKIKSAKESIIFSCGARQYIDCSYIFRFISPKKLGKYYKNIDPLLARYFSSLKKGEYKAIKQPIFFLLYRYSVNIFKLLFITIPSLFIYNLRSLQCYFFPKWARKSTYTKIKKFQNDYKVYAKRKSITSFFSEKTKKDFKLLSNHMITGSLPAAKIALIHGLLKISGISKNTKNKKLADLYQNVGFGLPGEIVVEMGAMMYILALSLVDEGISSVEDLEERIQSKKLPHLFLSKLAKFRKKFGCRGPNEMELTAPRYGDCDKLIASQVYQILTSIKSGHAKNPLIIQEENIQRRKSATQNLLKRLKGREKRKLKKVNHYIEYLGGFRDHPKLEIIQILYPFRNKAMVLGEKLYKINQIEEKNDIFHLKIHDLEKALLDKTYDLKSIVKKNKSFYQKVKTQVHHFPYLIDSRGRIIQQKIQIKRNQLIGEGLSRGIVKGRIKVLKHPSEKPVEPGDVLVTYNTDPGWTPLFINAAAIILEIGGVLQHGALIAREYGKPCVSNIEDVFDKFKDGQIVEVDGTTGVINFIEQ